MKLARTDELLHDNGPEEHHSPHQGDLYTSRMPELSSLQADPKALKTGDKTAEAKAHPFESTAELKAKNDLRKLRNDFVKSSH